MKYSHEELKKLILEKMEKYGYYYQAWYSTGSREDRDNRAYFRGQLDMLLECYDVPGYMSSKEAVEAYDKGIIAYIDGKEDNFFYTD